MPCTVTRESGVCTASTAPGASGSTSRTTRPRSSLSVRRTARLSASCTRAPVGPPSTATRAPAQVATTRDEGATVSQPPAGSAIFASATA